MLVVKVETDPPGEEEEEEEQAVAMLSSFMVDPLPMTAALMCPVGPQAPKVTAALTVWPEVLVELDPTRKIVLMYRRPI